MHRDAAATEPALLLPAESSMSSELENIINRHFSLARLLTNTSVSYGLAKDFKEMIDKIIQRPSYKTSLGSDGFPPLECSPCQQGDDEHYLGLLGGEVMQLHCQGQELKKESVAILRQARVPDRPCDWRQLLVKELWW